MQRDGLGYMFYLYFHSLTFALQENGPFSKSCEVAAFPAAASRDEIEQLRVQAAAAVRSYSEARAAAATEVIYQEAQRKAINETRFAALMEAFLRAAVAPPADAQGGSTADDVAETGSADDVVLVAGTAPSLGAPSVPIVIDGSGEAIYQAARRLYLLRINTLLGQARKAWNVGCVAPRKPKAIIAASNNIPNCGVKYPNPRRNPLKRRKLE